jgi:hypothetical protein
MALQRGNVFKLDYSFIAASRTTSLELATIKIRFF